jgi:mannose-6-phosphate isomerase-like protein (cupin superfamily)
MLCTICQSSASAQSGAAPTAAIDITDEQVKKVNAATGTDRQLRIVDMGKYNLAVGIIHRGPSARTTAGGAARPGGAPPAASGAPAPVPCGETGGPNSGVSGLYHDATAETYIIVSGSGTLVTGGRIVNGRRSAAESDVTRILNGPSCSGLIGGTDVVRRVVKPGDIIIIPAGVPHGWTEITDHVDYLSVRPDPDKVLQAGYVHPAIAK